tara:strand:+ start:1088 stop:1789 length:702 start_codon:yes stop_codon:yes gene_type:complete
MNLGQITAISSLNQLLRITQQEILKRATTIRTARHRLYLGISPNDCISPLHTDLPTWHLSEQISSQKVHQQAMPDQSVDQVISPLIVDSHYKVQSWLIDIQEWLPRGGWWMFPTIIQGSFEMLAHLAQQQSKLGLFQEMDALLQVLTSGRGQNPIVDCTRYQINYNRPEAMLNDFAMLTGQKVDDKKLSVEDASQLSVGVEIAHVAVKIAPQIRRSLRPINAPIKIHRVDKIH